MPKGKQRNVTWTKQKKKGVFSVGDWFEFTGSNGLVYEAYVTEADNENNRFKHSKPSPKGQLVSGANRAKRRAQMAKKRKEMKCQEKK